MATVAIADSSAIVALVKPDDSRHEDARAAAAALIRAQYDIVIPSEVIAETLNILGKKVSNAAAVEAGRKLLSGGFAIVQSQFETLLRAVDRLPQEKQSTSFVDTLVMVWADELKTDVILGFDAVFQRSGYRLGPTEAGRADGGLIKPK